MPDGELIISQFIEDHIGSPGCILEEVLHVDDPGEYTARRQLAQHALFHHLEHVVADKLYRVQFGRKHVDSAIEIQHRFAEQGHRRWHRCIMRLRQPRQVEQSGADSHASTAHIVIAADQASYILAERPAVDIPGYLNHLQVGIGYTVPQAFRESQQEKDDLILLVGVEAPDHTEVHQGQAAVIGEHDIAWMGVAVENAIDDDLLEIGRKQVFGDGTRVE